MKSRQKPLDDGQIVKILCGLFGGLASFDGNVPRIRELVYQIAETDDIWERLERAFEGLDKEDYEQVKDALKGRA